MTKVSAIYAKIPGICSGLDAELGCSLVQYIPQVAGSRLGYQVPWAEEAGKLGVRMLFILGPCLGQE